MYRLHGREFPRELQELLDEGRRGAERPGTMAAALARIDEANAILRNQGIGLGKADYVAHMLTFLRPDSPGDPISG